MRLLAHRGVSRARSGEQNASTGLCSRNGKCGFVTGSTRDPGKVIALELTQYGATLVQADIDDPEKSTANQGNELGMIVWDCTAFRAFGILVYAGSF